MYVCECIAGMYWTWEFVYEVFSLRFGKGKRKGEGKVRSHIPATSCGGALSYLRFLHSTEITDTGDDADTDTDTYLLDSYSHIPVRTLSLTTIVRKVVSASATSSPNPYRHP